MANVVPATALPADAALSESATFMVVDDGVVSLATAATVGAAINTAQQALDIGTLQLLEAAPTGATGYGIPGIYSRDGTALTRRTDLQRGLTFRTMTDADVTSNVHTMVSTDLGRCLVVPAGKTWTFNLTPALMGAMVGDESFVIVQIPYTSAVSFLAVTVGADSSTLWERSAAVYAQVVAPSATTVTPAVDRIARVVLTFHGNPAQVFLDQ